MLVSMMVAGSVMYGGSKGKARQGIRAITRRIANVQPAGVEFFASNWNMRGAWRDSMKIEFENGWVFPHGSNHLESVEVMAWGEVRTRHDDTNAIASIGMPLAIVPGLTVFAQELTPSNSYRFAWTDAAAQRDTNTLVSAAIELMRNGDVIVTVDGEETRTARRLPFDHDGYGQDEDWIRANFANATEIIAKGYTNWVDGQVGENEENGLYKFTLSLAKDPPEAVRLAVGGYSLAVTNAGEYVFLLEKGVDYDYGTNPFMEDVVCGAVDDVPAENPRRRAVAQNVATRGWTVAGCFTNEMQSAESPGKICWLPTLCGSPDVAHIGPDANPMTFTAKLSDYCRTDVAYEWTVSEGLTVAAPNAKTTEIEITSMPSWAQASLAVSARIGNHTLVSSLENLTYGTNTVPQVHIALNVPDALLLNSNETDFAKIAKAGWTFESDAPTSGILRVACTSGARKVKDSGLAGEWRVHGGEVLFGATLEGIETSEAVGDVKFRAEFASEDGTEACVRGLTVIETKDIVVPDEPEDGVAVLKNTHVEMRLKCKPSGAEKLLTTLWQTRRLRGDGSFSKWHLTGIDYAGGEYTFMPAEGGIYQIRTFATVSGGGSDERYYVWDADENTATGHKKKGQMKAIGVCDEQWQMDLRNAAKSYLGSAAYAFAAALPGEYGFSPLPSDSWKCNYFVAYRIKEAGLPLEVQRRRLWHSYPPLANDWANGAEIPNWEYLGTMPYVQPGYVVGHPASYGSGHVGILDFDGEAIAAGRYIVNRNYEEWLDGTSGFNRCNDEQD